MYASWRQDIVCSGYNSYTAWSRKPPTSCNVISTVADCSSATDYIPTMSAPASTPAAPAPGSAGPSGGSGSAGPSCYDSTPLFSFLLLLFTLDYGHVSYSESVM